MGKDYFTSKGSVEQTIRIDAGCQIYLFLLMRNIPEIIIAMPTK